MEYFITVLKKYAVFSGRARRKEYWIFCLISMLFNISLMLIETMLGILGISILYTLVLLIPSISVLVRRLHDTNRSAWWILIVLIPLIGAIALFVFLVLDSDDDNAYGPNPKATS